MSGEITDHQARFLERVPRTPMSSSYRFSRPEGFEFLAGQYIILTLGEGDALRHPLSLSDCPGEKGHIEITKRMTGSPFCERLESLEPGETVSVRGPAGQFTPGDSETEFVFLTGGIGITPIRSILKQMHHTGEKRPVLLIYGNRDETDIAFLDELSSLEMPGFRVVHVLAQPKGEIPAHEGFITDEVIAKEVTDPPSCSYYISGPPPMVDAMSKALAKLEVPPEKLSTDRFLGYD